MARPGAAAAPNPHGAATECLVGLRLRAAAALSLFQFQHGQRIGDVLEHRHPAADLKPILEGDRK